MSTGLLTTKPQQRWDRKLYSLQAGPALTIHSSGTILNSYKINIVFRVPPVALLHFSADVDNLGWETKLLFYFLLWLMVKARSKGRDSDWWTHSVDELCPGKSATKAVQTPENLFKHTQSSHFFSEARFSHLVSQQLPTTHGQKMWRPYTVKEDLGKNLEGSEPSSHCKSPLKTEHPCVQCCSSLFQARIPCSRNVKKNCWSIFFSQITQPYFCFLYRGTSLLWQKKQYSSSFGVACFGADCLECLEAIKQISPRWQCSVNKAYSHQNSGGFTAISKGNRVKLEDRQKQWRASLHMGK